MKQKYPFFEIWTQIMLHKCTANQYFNNKHVIICVQRKIIVYTSMFCENMCRNANVAKTCQYCVGVYN